MSGQYSLRELEHFAIQINQTIFYTLNTKTDLCQLELTLGSSSSQINGDKQEANQIEHHQEGTLIWVNDPISNSIRSRTSSSIPSTAYKI